MNHATRIILDVDVDDHPVRRRARLVGEADLLEEAEAVQAALGPVDQHAVVGIALGQVELAADDVVAGTGVAADVDALDVDARAVLDHEAEGHLMGGAVALTGRPHLGEGVALAVDLVGDADERLLDILGVVDIANLGADLPVERLAVDAGDTRINGHRADGVLLTLFDGDGDDPAGLVAGLDVAGIGVDDAEVGVAVLEVVAAHDVEVGGDAVGIVDVGGLDEREEVHLGRRHQTLEGRFRVGAVADEVDGADTGLVALVDGEDDVGAAGGKVDEIGRAHV